MLCLFTTGSRGTPVFLSGHKPRKGTERKAGNREGRGGNLERGRLSYWGTQEPAGCLGGGEEKGHGVGGEEAICGQFREITQPSLPEARGGDPGPAFHLSLNQILLPDTSTFPVMVGSLVITAVVGSLVTTAVRGPGAIRTPAH